ncbi:MAG: 3'-5' exonuclease [Flavobacteriaceae bacterium]|nr:3'-5' exonuclease [Flavobacteriaceae bacterium]
MQLQLKKPIVFFDLETTGTNIAKDRIVEIALCKVHPDGKEEIKTYRVNPEMPIPIEVSEIHGIYDGDVEDCPTFKEIGKEVASFITGCDLGGYNSNRFDVPLLAEELLRVGIDHDIKRHRLVDVQVIFHTMEKRTLEAAYKFYCDKELKDAHSAEADTLATYEVLKSQLDRYQEDLDNDIDFLSDFTTRTKNADFAGFIAYDDNGREIFNFGKFKGRLVEEVLESDPGYFGWILNSEFPLYTKKVLTNIKLRKATLF